MQSTRLTVGEGWVWERTSKENEFAEDHSKMVRVSEWVSSGAVNKWVFKRSSQPRWMQSDRRLDLPHVRGSWAAKLLLETDNRQLQEIPIKEIYQASESTSSSSSRTNTIFKETIEASPQSQSPKLLLLDIEPIFNRYQRGGTARIHRR